MKKMLERTESGSVERHSCPRPTPTVDLHIVRDCLSRLVT